MNNVVTTITGSARSASRTSRTTSRGRLRSEPVTGMEHSPTSATGTGWEPTPWHATRRAAWKALRRLGDEWPKQAESDNNREPDPTHGHLGREQLHAMGSSDRL